jgi:hypothetical protein
VRAQQILVSKLRTLPREIPHLRAVRADYRTQGRIPPIVGFILCIAGAAGLYSGCIAELPEGFEVVVKRLALFPAARGFLVVLRPRPRPHPLWMPSALCVTDTATTSARYQASDNPFRQATASSGHALTQLTLIGVALGECFREFCSKEEYLD